MQASGRRFDPVWLHHFLRLARLVGCRGSPENSSGRKSDLRPGLSALSPVVGHREEKVQSIGSGRSAREGGWVGRSEQSLAMRSAGGVSLKRGILAAGRIGLFVAGFNRAVVDWNS